MLPMVTARVLRPIKGGESGVAAAAVEVWLLMLSLSAGRPSSQSHKCMVREIDPRTRALWYHAGWSASGKAGDGSHSLLREQAARYHGAGPGVERSSHV